MRTFLYILIFSFMIISCKTNNHTEPYLELSIKPSSGGNAEYYFCILDSQIILKYDNKEIVKKLSKVQIDSLSLLTKKTLVYKRDVSEEGLLALDSWEYLLKVNGQIIDRSLVYKNDKPFYIRTLIEYIIRLSPRKIVLEGFS